MTQPLAGVCVLDFSTLLTGPLAGGELVTGGSRCRCPSTAPSAARPRSATRR